MKINFNYVAAVVVSASCVFSVSAQTAKPTPKIVGKMIDIEGLVTVTRGNNLINATDKTPMLVDDRIVTTSGGGVTLDFDNGCNITLKGNQFITINDSRDCKALIAGIQPVGAPAAAVAGTDFTGPLLIGGVVGLGLILNNQSNKRLSGS